MLVNLLSTGGDLAAPFGAVAAVVVDTSFANSGGSSVETLDITPPDNIADDLLLIMHVTDGTFGTITTPTGYTDVVKGYTGSGESTISLFRKTSSGGESDPVTLQTSLFEKQIGGMLTLRGQKESDPIDAVGANNSGTDANPVCTGLTTTVDQALLVACMSNDGARSYTPPSGMDEQVDQATSGTGSCAGSMATAAQALSGASGDKTFTMSSAEQWGGFMIAVKPA
jgi:hypothetical protein